MTDSCRLEAIMQRVTFSQGAPEEPEVAVLKLTSKEHADLHKRKAAFVNEHKVFNKNVRDVKFQPESHEKTTAKAGAPWMVAMFHYPACTAVASCVPA